MALQLKKIPRQKVVGTHPQKALFWHNDIEIPFKSSISIHMYVVNSNTK